MTKAKKNKYRAVKTVVDNIMFSSKREAARYLQLKLMLKAGVIEKLQLQPRYKLFIGDNFICTYVADFIYRDAKTGDNVVEDVKGVKTPVYRLKKKMLRACYGIEVREI